MDSHQSVNCLPVYVAVFVDVEVNTWTGQVCTVRAAMGSDRGTFINPGMVVGQLEERLLKEMGSALYEDKQWDPQGVHV